MVMGNYELITGLLQDFSDHQIAPGFFYITGLLQDFSDVLGVWVGLVESVDLFEV